MKGGEKNKLNAKPRQIPLLGMMREQYGWGGWEEKREGEKFEEKIAGRYL